MKSQRFGLTLSAVVFALVLVSSFAFGADRLIVQDSGSNDVFTVDDTGKVFGKKLGIATLTPQSAFHISEQNGADPNRGIISSQHYDGTSAAVFNYKRSRGTAASPTALTDGDAIGAFHFWGYDGTNYHIVSSIRGMTKGTVGTNSVPSQLWFHTGTNSTDTLAAPRMVINSSGNVGIGTTTPTHLIQLSGGAYSDGAVWTDASSREYKENINELTTQAAMDAFTKLAPVTFSYKTDAEKQHVGFIAEDVPDLVATKDRKGLSAMDIVAVLTKDWGNH